MLFSCSKNQTFSTNLLSLLYIRTIQRSWWKLASLVIERAVRQNIDITKQFDDAVREKNIQIRKLQSFYNANSQKFAVISPAYQWAEGLEEIALNIKLAHKWDAPATLGCDDIHLNFTETTVILEANCSSTGKSFKMNLQLADKLNPEKCTWSKAAVSRIVVNLVKKERGMWPSLLGYGLRTPRNAHPWYSMQEQLKKKDEEMLEAENVEKRLAERKREKELREREDRLMEERRHKK
ncbi:hypothetical protein WA171_006069 [Blastocystis sp. BT1]